MVLLNLFLAFLKIGFFAVGGAYSFLPLVKNEVVENHHWLSNEEFADMSGITQIFPGAISIKYATYTGYKMGGIPGVILAIIGSVLAPTILILLATILYTRYKDLNFLKETLNTIRLTVFAMIIAIAFQMVDFHNLIQAKSLIIIVFTLSIFLFTKVPPGVVIVFAGLVGTFWR